MSRLLRDRPASTLVAPLALIALILVALVLTGVVVGLAVVYYYNDIVEIVG